ncbi:hypothetical protein Ciccas_011774 [Cichlidogyrus casuarinus]|uniref:Kinase D-interacting substrate of 220 kDa-like SAM domain-containing protein n=1 Tax=Cichlidogyrus casuarinus TaxID=1844966 RepID=A0ABD2PQ95_9PLAT
MLQEKQGWYKLSQMTVNQVCNLVTMIQGTSETRVQLYQSRVKQQNINGFVLSVCDLDSLRTELGMSFGDYQLFSNLVLSLRKLEQPEDGRKSDQLSLSVSQTPLHRQTTRTHSGAKFDENPNDLLLGKPLFDENFTTSPPSTGEDFNFGPHMLGFEQTSEHSKHSSRKSKKCKKIKRSQSQSRNVGREAYCLASSTGFVPVNPAYREISSTDDNFDPGNKISAKDLLTELQAWAALPKSEQKKFRGLLMGAGEAEEMFCGGQMTTDSSTGHSKIEEKCTCGYAHHGWDGQGQQTRRLLTLSEPGSRCNSRPLSPTASSCCSTDAFGSGTQEDEECNSCTENSQTTFSPPENEMNYSARSKFYDTVSKYPQIRNCEV